MLEDAPPPPPPHASLRAITNPSPFFLFFLLILFPPSKFPEAFFKVRSLFDLHLPRVRRTHTTTCSCNS